MGLTDVFCLCHCAMTESERHQSLSLSYKHNSAVRESGLNMFFPLSLHVRISVLRHEGDMQNAQQIKFTNYKYTHTSHCARAKSLSSECL